MRLFLDANVLFSASYRVESPLLALWALQGVDVELVTSRYAVQEALTNLAHETQQDRLIELLRHVRVVTEAPPVQLAFDLDLPDKDRPILAAAVGAGTTHLVTGDLTFFGRLFGRRIGDMVVLTPRILLDVIRTRKE